MILTILFKSVCMDVQDLIIGVPLSYVPLKVMKSLSFVIFSPKMWSNTRASGHTVSWSNPTLFYLGHVKKILVSNPEWHTLQLTRGLRKVKYYTFFFGLNLPWFRRGEREPHIMKKYRLSPIYPFPVEVCSWAWVTPLVASPAPPLTLLHAAKRPHYLPSEQHCPAMPPHIPCVCVLTHDRDVILNQEQSFLAALHQHGQSVSVLLSV